MSYLLPRLVGASAAAELLFTGLNLSTQRALRFELVSEVVAENDLAHACAKYVDAMLVTAPLSLAMTKELFNIDLDAPSFEAALALEDRNQVVLGQTANFREGVMAFEEKRLPSYTGRRRRMLGGED